MFVKGRYFFFSHVIGNSFMEKKTFKDNFKRKEECKGKIDI